MNVFDKVNTLPPPAFMSYSFIIPRLQFECELLYFVPPNMDPPPLSPPHPYTSHTPMACQSNDKNTFAKGRFIHN